MAEFETEQIEVFSPEQKKLFEGLMNYLMSGQMLPGGTYQFRSPRIVNQAFSSFPEGHPWRGASMSGTIPQPQVQSYKTGMDWIRPRGVYNAMNYRTNPVNTLDQTRQAFRQAPLRVPGVGPGGASLVYGPRGMTTARKGTI